MALFILIFFLLVLTIPAFAQTSKQIKPHPSPIPPISPAPSPPIQPSYGARCKYDIEIVLPVVIKYPGRYGVNPFFS